MSCCRWNDNKRNVSSCLHDSLYSIYTLFILSLVCFITSYYSLSRISFNEGKFYDILEYIYFYCPLNIYQRHFFEWNLWTILETAIIGFNCVISFLHWYLLCNYIKIIFSIDFFHHANDKYFGFRCWRLDNCECFYDLSLIYSHLSWLIYESRND